MKLRHVIGGGVGLIAVTVAALAIYGSTQPRDHEVSATVQLERPTAEVFAIVEDVASHPCWRTGLSKVEIVSESPRRFVEHVDGETVTYEVDERVEGRKLVVRIADEDLPYGGSWTYELTPVDGGTALTITERGFVDGVVLRGIAALVMDPLASIAQYERDIQGFSPCD